MSVHGVLVSIPDFIFTRLKGVKRHF